jgi:hypothetical protein
MPPPRPGRLTPIGVGPLPGWRSRWCRCRTRRCRTTAATTPPAAAPPRRSAAARAARGAAARAGAAWNWRSASRAACSGSSSDDDRLLAFTARAGLVGPARARRRAQLDGAIAIADQPVGQSPKSTKGSTTATSSNGTATSQPRR